MTALAPTRPAAPSAPWDPLPSEAPDEYAAFWAWLLTSPRPTPADVNPNLSPTWRERAGAWDLQCAVHQATGGTAGPKELARTILAGYLQIAVQETIKLHRASLMGERVMSARDVREAVGLIESWSALAPAADTGQIDLTQASAEERAVLLKALPILERIRRKPQ